MTSRNSLQIGDKPLLSNADSAIWELPHQRTDRDAAANSAPALTTTVVEATYDR